MSDCGADENGCFNKDLALKLRIAALFTIMCASAIGIFIPLLGRSVRFLRPERDAFLFVKSFAAGVILSTGFVHVFPDAYESLTNPCLPGTTWSDYPFAGLVSMFAALVTLVLDFTATSYYDRIHDLSSANNSKKENLPQAAHHHDKALADPHAQSHAISLEDDAMSSTLRHKVVSQVLELGIVAHSVIIGIAMGASQVPCTIRPLFAALTFHQFFEGVGLGGCIALAQFKTESMILMALAFSLTTPLGIAIGIGISSSYNENSPKALIIQGLFDAASSGILIYMALVDLIATDFLGKRMRRRPLLQLFCCCSLFVGAGLMSLLAKWS